MSALAGPVCVQRSQAESSGGSVVVMDGIGVPAGQVAVGEGQTRAFPVRLGQDGCLSWRFDDPDGQDRMEAFPVIQTLKPSSRTVAYLQVARNGPDVVWTYYEQDPATKPPAWGPGSPADAAFARKPDVAGAGDLQPEAYARAALGLTQELLDYVGETPRRLSSLCCAGGAAVAVAGLVDVVNIWGACSHVVYYIFHCYAMFFGLVTCVNELEHELVPQWSETLFEVKTWMRHWAKGLTTLWGRGLFYFFQGLSALVGSTSGKLGEVIGIYMMVMGIACFNTHFRSRGPDPLQGAYVQIA